MSVQFKPNLSRYIKFALKFQEVMENGTDIEKEKIMKRHSFWVGRLQDRKVGALSVVEAEREAGIKEEYRAFC